MLKLRVTIFCSILYLASIPNTATQVAILLASLPKTSRTRPDRSYRAALLALALALVLIPIAETRAARKKLGVNV